MLNFILYVLVGLVFIAVGLPLYFRKVSPNHWYGFRTKETMANEALWYEVNSTGGMDFALLGFVVLVVAVILRFFLQPDSQVFAIVISAVAFVGTLVCVIHGTTALRRVSERSDDVRTG